jgi:hypothetical protein
MECKMDQWHEWTTCEWNGHQFEDGSCTDCGEPQE